MKKIYLVEIEMEPDAASDDFIKAHMLEFEDRAKCKVTTKALPEWTEADQPLPEDEAIREAFPTRSGRHDLYVEALRLVGAKRSKFALVDLVNWLLHREAAAEGI